MLKFDVDRTEKGKSILIPCQDKLLRVQIPDSDSIFQFHEFVGILLCFLRNLHFLVDTVKINCNV